MLTSLRRHLSYSNVTASLALFVALSGTSYAVLKVDSGQVANNSLRSADLRDNSVRSRDLRNRTIRARDVGRNALGAAVVNEGSLGRVPRAGEAERVGGATAGDLRVRCPEGTIAKAGVCIESTPRSALGFHGATTVCDNAGRALPSMPELSRFATLHGPLAAEGEWTSSVYLYSPNGGTTFDQLEALLVGGGGDVGHARVNAPNPHPFRCVALPAN